MTRFCDYASSLRAQTLTDYGLRVVSAVEEEPITVADARRHIGIAAYGSPPSSFEDAWLEENIPTAREYCEHLLGASIGQQTLEFSLSAFPSADLVLPFGPVSSIVSINYLDADNENQAVDPEDYVLNDFVEPQTLMLAFGATWPTALDYANSVKIRYTVGYSLPGDSPSNPVPRTVRLAMLLLLAHWRANKEATIAQPGVTIQNIPHGVESLLEPHRVRLSMA